MCCVNAGLKTTSFFFFLPNASRTFHDVDGSDFGRPSASSLIVEKCCCYYLMSSEICVVLPKEALALERYSISIFFFFVVFQEWWCPPAGLLIPLDSELTL